jgi:hypothetical protein
VVGSSCSIQKRHYNKGFHITKFSKVQLASGVQQKSVEDKVAEPLKLEKSAEKLLVNPTVVEVPEDSSFVQLEEEMFLDSNECDVIVFRDSHQEECIVKEVTSTEIKYKKCGFEEGPLYTKNISEVSGILYRNGTKEFYGNYVKPEVGEASDDYINGYNTWASDPRDIEVFSVLSLVFSLLYFIPGLSVIFGIIGLRQFKKEPGKYKGKGFAYVGIGIGSATLLFILIAFIIFII